MVAEVSEAQRELLVCQSQIGRVIVTSSAALEESIRPLSPLCSLPT